MLNIPVIAKRELNTYFLSPTAYVVLTLFVLVNGLVFVIAIADAAVAGALGAPIDMNALAAYGLQVAVYVLIVFVPLITMRLISEESASGTAEMLLTAPVGTWEIVLGKYVGALLFGVAMLVPVLLECLFLVYVGGLDYGPLASGLLALYLLTAQFLAIGLFCSSLTRTQIASALTSLVFLILLQFTWLLVPGGRSPVAGALKYMAPLSHIGDLLSGIVSTVDLVYFVATTALLVFLSTLGLEAKRLAGMFSGGGRRPLWRKLSHAGIAAGLLVAFGASIAGDVAAQALTRIEGLSVALVVLRCGGLLIAAAGAAANGDALLRWARRRQAAAGANLIVTAVLATALAGFVCYIGTRRYTRIDMTGKRLYSLSQKTSAMLAGLERPVKVTIVYYKTDRIGDRAYRWSSALLKQFESLSARFTVEDVGPRDADGLAALKERVGYIPGPCFIFESGGSRDIVELAETVWVPRSPGEGWRFLAETAFAAALAKVTQPEGQGVYFLTGHDERPMQRFEGEADPAGMRVAEDSLSLLVQRLTNDAYRCASLDLEEQETVPGDCAVLIIPDPQRPLPAEHIDAVRQYLGRRKGSVIVLVDSRAGRPGESNVNEVLSQYGIRVHQDALGIYRKGDREAVDGVLVQGEGFSLHPVTRDLNRIALTLKQCAPVEVVDESPDPGLVARTVMTGPASSWGERDVPEDRTQAEFGPGDMPGPVTVAALVGPTAALGSPRLLVVGTSVSFINREVATHPENLYLLLNAVNWMAGREHMVGIPSKDMALGRATLTAVQVRVSGWMFLLVVPAAFVALGLAVWAVRRH